MRSERSPEQRWAAQWAETGNLLDDMRARELRALTDREALAIADELLSLAVPDWPPAPPSSSGLVDFQRLLRRMRP